MQKYSHIQLLLMLITVIITFSQSDIIIIESIYQQWYILDGLGIEASEVCKITRIPASWSHNISTHPVWQLPAWEIILVGIPQCRTDHKLFMPKILMKSHFRGNIFGRENSTRRNAILPYLFPFQDSNWRLVRHLHDMAVVQKCGVSNFLDVNIFWCHD